MTEAGSIGSRSGSASGSLSSNDPGLRVSVSPVDMATIQRKLSVGSTLTARVLEFHGNGKYTVGFAGMRMFAESALPLAQGARVAVQVMALEPRIHLRALDPQGDGALDRILQRNGFLKPTAEMRELVAAFMERELPIDHRSLQQGVAAMKQGLDPRGAARFVAAEAPLSEASIARVAGGGRSVAGALERLAGALRASGREAAAAAIREALEFRGDFAEAMRRHPLGAERRLLSRDGDVAVRSTDLPRLLDELVARSDRNGDEIRRAAGALRGALDSADLAAAGRAVGRLTGALHDAGRLEDLARLREALVEPATARAMARGEIVTPREYGRVLLEARTLLVQLGRGSADRALSRVPPEVSRAAGELAAQLDSGETRSATLRTGLERLALRLQQHGAEGAAARLHALAAAAGETGPPGTGLSPELRVGRELGLHLMDSRALLLELASEGQNETGGAARELLEVIEGHALFGHPEAHLPFVVDDEGMKDAELWAERSRDRAIVRFRLDTSRLGSVVGVMDFHRRVFGMALGVTRDDSRKELRAALPELNRALEALGFRIESVTIDRKREADENERERPVLGLDIKA